MNFNESKCSYMSVNSIDRCCCHNCFHISLLFLHISDIIHAQWIPVLIFNRNEFDASHHQQLNLDKIVFLSLKLKRHLYETIAKILILMCKHKLLINRIKTCSNHSYVVKIAWIYSPKSCIDDDSTLLINRSKCNKLSTHIHWFWSECEENTIELKLFFLWQAFDELMRST